MILVVESVFELPDALHCPVHLLVPAEHDEDGVRFSVLRIERFDVKGGSLNFLVVLIVEEVRH
jgi:hypothetical protein